MEAVRLHPNLDGSKPYSAENPAPASALTFDSDVPIPQNLKPGELLVKVKASTVIRDALIWPETYDEEYKILGNDFAGTVAAVNGESSSFKIGDEVYGMTEANRAGAWAEYVVVLENEAWFKPKSLSWAQAAAMPLSALTAYQAIFVQAGVSPPDFTKSQALSKLRSSKGSTEKGTILITGASGCVGLYMVQLARMAGLYVVAATRSNERNREYLLKLGADEAVEYQELTQHSKRFEVIIDSVGGQTLENSWSLVEENGTLVSIDSASYNFVEDHKKTSAAAGSEKVKAIWFIVSASEKDLQQLTAVVDAQLLEPLVASVMPMSKAHLAYDQSLSMPTARGKIVLTTGSG